MDTRRLVCVCPSINRWGLTPDCSNLFRPEDPSPHIQRLTQQLFRLEHPLSAPEIVHTWRPPPQTTPRHCTDLKTPASFYHHNCSDLKSPPPITPGINQTWRPFPILPLKLFGLEDPPPPTTSGVVQTWGPLFSSGKDQPETDYPFEIRQF